MLQSKTSSFCCCSLLVGGCQFPRVALFSLRISQKKERYKFLSDRCSRKMPDAAEIPSKDVGRISPTIPVPVPSSMKETTGASYRIPSPPKFPSATVASRMDFLFPSVPNGTSKNKPSLGQENGDNNAVSNSHVTKGGLWDSSTRLWNSRDEAGKLLSKEASPKSSRRNSAFGNAFSTLGTTTGVKKATASEVAQQPLGLFDLEVQLNQQHARGRETSSDVRAKMLLSPLKGDKDIFRERSFDPKRELRRQLSEIPRANMRKYEGLKHIMAGDDGGGQRSESAGPKPDAQRSFDELKAISMKLRTSFDREAAKSNEKISELRDSQSFVRSSADSLRDLTRRHSFGASFRSARSHDALEFSLNMRTARSVQQGAAQQSVDAGEEKKSVQSSIGSLPPRPTSSSFARQSDDLSIVSETTTAPGAALAGGHAFRPASRVKDAQEIGRVAELYRYGVPRSQAEFFGKETGAAPSERRAKKVDQHTLEFEQELLSMRQMQVNMKIALEKDASREREHPTHTSFLNTHMFHASPAKSSVGENSLCS